MVKYYRVKQDTFLWKKGAIISNEDLNRGYQPIEDIWNTVSLKNDELGANEYISAPIIEAPENADIFERVYRDDIAGKVFRTAEQLKESYDKAFK